MLEHLPAAVGHTLKGQRAGLDAVAAHREAAAVPAVITVTSPAFAEGDAMPSRFTADGPGLSPPLAWRGVPAGAAAVLVLVQDADSPTPEPLVHLIVPDLDGADGTLAEGVLPGPAGEGQAGHDLGRNSFFRRGWLPPDPPTGHGPHRYIIQVYALSRAVTYVEGKGAALKEIAAAAIAKGSVTATYERPG